MKTSHKTTLDYLDAIRAKLGTPGRPASDYAAAKALHVQTSTISRYRTGRGGFDDKAAIRAAKILGLPAESVLLDVQIERDAPPEVRQLWERIAARVASAALCVTFAAALLAEKATAAVCILCSMNTARRRVAQALDVLDALA